MDALVNECVCTDQKNWLLVKVETQPPVLKPSLAATPDPANPIVIYPDPQDGYLDTVTFSVWLSKLSTVTLHAGGKAKSYDLGHGTQTITWPSTRKGRFGRIPTL